MKKKIAVLLASVMALSSLPSTLFAATDNGLSKSVYVVGASVRMLESGWLYQPGSVGKGSALASGTNNTIAKQAGLVQLTNSSVNYGDADGDRLVVDGTDLVLKTTNTEGFQRGTTFEVRLEGAQWSFGAKIGGGAKGKPVTEVYDTNKGTWTGGTNFGTYYRGLSVPANNNTVTGPFYRMAPYNFVVADNWGTTYGDLTTPSEVTGNASRMGSIVTPWFGREINKPGYVQPASGLADGTKLSDIYTASKKNNSTITAAKKLEPTSDDKTAAQYVTRLKAVPTGATVSSFATYADNIYTSMIETAQKAGVKKTFFTDENGTPVITTSGALTTTPSALGASVGIAGTRVAIPSDNTVAASEAVNFINESNAQLVKINRAVTGNPDNYTAAQIYEFIRLSTLNLALANEAMSKAVAQNEWKKTGVFVGKAAADADYISAVSPSTVSTAVYYDEVPYMLEVKQPNNNIAIVTILADTTPSTVNRPTQINIPIVATTSTSDGSDIKAVVTSYTANINSGTYFITNISSTATNTRLESTAQKTADEFRLDRLTIEELRIGSIKNTGSFYLTAPAGYRFVNNFNDNAGSVEAAINNPNGEYASGQPIVRVSLGGGLRWDPIQNDGAINNAPNSAVNPAELISKRSASVFGYNPVSDASLVQAGWDTKFAWYGIQATNGWYTSTFSGSNPWASMWWNYPSMYQSPNTSTVMGRGQYYINTGINNNITGITSNSIAPLKTDYSIGYYYDPVAGQFDPTRVRVDFKNVVAYSAVTNVQNNITAANLPGKMYVTGLKLVPYDTASTTGDLLMAITNIDAGITSQDKINVGTRVERNVKITATTSPIPTLISGRYADRGHLVDQYNTVSAAKASIVKFEETVVNAWWSGKTTEFTLVTSANPNAAKFRKVRLTDRDKIQVNQGESSNRYFDTDLFVNNDALNVSQQIKVTSEQIIINNVFVTDYAIAKFNIQSWLSIAADYEGDVKLALAGSAIADADKNPGIVIAQAIPAVKVTTETSPVKIGYQEQTTANVKISENGAGYLQVGKTVTVDVTDRIKDDVAFATAGSYTITPADSGLAITVPKVANGTIIFDITKASVKPATIEFTGLSVKISRDAPESSELAYDLIVGGNAVASNWDEDKVDTVGDKFTTKGVRPLAADGTVVKYLSINYPANNKLDSVAGIITELVEIETKEGSAPGYTKGGVFHDADPNGVPYDYAAYVSASSNSTMVPFRMLAHAFGLKDEQIVWDDANKTATLLTASKVVQLKANSDVMLVNGVEIRMQSPDGLPVQAEITNERIYLPFRSMGNAFGVVVDWDANARVAKYIPNSAN